MITTLKTKRKSKEGIKRRFFRDKYNDKKIWEVAYLKGTYLIRQYLENNDSAYHLLGRGSRRNKKELIELGLLGFEEITNIRFI